MNILYAVIATSITLGVLFMVFIAPVMLYKGVCMVTYGELEGTDKICQYVPILNLYKAESIYVYAYGGRGTHFIFPTSSLLLLTLIIIRLIQVFVSPLAVQSGVMLILCVIVMTIVVYASNIWFVHNILEEDTRVFGLKRTLYHILPMLASYYICMDLSYELHRIKESEAAV